MRERPILFSAPMVNAILAGRKTQTRRVVKGEKPGQPLDWLSAGFTPEFVAEPENGLCPYGVPGDRLWVREACWLYGRWIERGVTTTGRPKRSLELIGRQARHDNPGYHHTAHYGGNDGWSWRPGIHMPRWASRITLEVTGVRVERLNDIGAADALAEGMTFPEAIEWGCDPKDAFFGLWEHINGPGSWGANPFVWVVEFKRVPQ
jgi:hypothetical protein